MTTLKSPPTSPQPTPQPTPIDYYTHTGMVSLLELKESLNELAEQVLAAKKDPTQLIPALEKMAEIQLIWNEGNQLALTCGTPYRLQQTASQIYMLPYFEEVIPENTRWILCQYAGAGNNPPGFQIIACKYLDNDSSTLEPLNSIYYLEENEVDNKLHDFNLRLRKIETQTTFDDEVVCKVTLKNGYLIITISPEDGIRDINIKRVSNESNLRTERCSHTAMQPILHIGKSASGKWQDDTLILPGTGRKPIAFNDISIGHIIGGVDQYPGDHGVWMGNNSGEVLYLLPDPSNKTEPILVTKTLSGKICDTLCIKDPSSKEPKIPTALVSTSDNKLYFLSYENKKINIIKQQHSRLHIVRTTGIGEDKVFALEAGQYLFPLKINLSEELNKQWENSLSSLYQTIHNKDRPLDLSKSYDRNKLLLIFEYALIDPDRKTSTYTHLDDAFSHKAWQALLDADDIAQFQSRIELQQRVMMRWWCYIRHLQQENKALPPKNIELSQAFINLPDNAPDKLWLNLFKNHKFYCHFTENEKQGLEEKPGVQDWLVTLNEKIHQHRYKMIPGINKFRLFAIEKDYYIGKTPRHIRLMDDLGKSFCFVEYNGDLKIHLEGTEKPTFALTPGWIGLADAIATGKGLEENLGLTEQSRYPILVTTRRGEIHLFLKKKTCNKWSEASLTVKENSQSMDIRCICSHSIKVAKVNNTEKHYLLGGATSKRKACISSLHFKPTAKDTWEYNISPIWVDNTNIKGAIRMLALDNDKQPKKLWAIDRYVGNLYCWSNTGPLKLNSQLPEPDLIMTDRRGLYALHIAPPCSAEHRTLVCGGLEGQVYAFNPDNNRLIWTSGCGKALHRAIYIPYDLEKEKGYWLLAGAHLHLILVSNKSGRTCHILEQGPIPAMRVANADPKNFSFLVASSTGRLLKYSSKGVSTIDNESLSPLLLSESSPDKKVYSLFYQLSSGEKAPHPTPETLLCWLATLPSRKERRKAQIFFNSILDFQVSFKYMKVLLINTSSHKEEYYSRLKQLIYLLHTMSAMRLSWFFHHLDEHMKNKPEPSFDPEKIYILIRVCWKYVRKRTRIIGDTPCQPVAELVRSKLIRTDYYPSLIPDSILVDRFKKLEQFLYSCIWKKASNKEENNNNEPCPDAFSRASRVISLQAGILSWLYSKARLKSDEEPVIINDWLHHIWKTLPEEKQNEPNYITHTILSMHYKLGDYYLNATDNKMELNLKTNILLKESELPEPFSDILILYTKSKSIYISRYKIENYFNTIKGWGEFVESWFSYIDNRNTNIKNEKRVLWRERATLQSLQLLLADEQISAFRVRYKAPLISYYLTLLKKNIISEIAKDINALQNRKDVQDFIDIDVSPEWSSVNQKVSLRFNVINRYIDSIQLLKVSMDRKNQDLIDLEIRGETHFPTSDKAIAFRTLAPIEINKNKIIATLTFHMRIIATETDFICKVNIDESRNLSSFLDSLPASEQKNWAEMIQYLEKLLTRRTDFIWIDGNYWTAEQRSLLKRLVEKNYGADMSIQYRSFAKAMIQPESDNITSWFSPDLPLNNPEGDLGWAYFAHQLLHAEKKHCFNPYAFELWLKTHKNIAPWFTGKHSQSLLPSSTAHSGLGYLSKLGFSHENEKSLLTEIEKLDGKLVGAWCNGYPLYLNKLLETPASMFPVAWWNQELLELESDSDNLSDISRYLRPDVPGNAYLATNQISKTDFSQQASGMEELAKNLSEKEYQWKYYNNHRNAGKKSYIQLTYSENLTLIDEDFTNLVIIPPNLDHQKRDRISGMIPADCAVLNFDADFKITCNLSIYLSPQDVHRLILNTNYQSAIHALNHIATKQHPNRAIEAPIFSTSNGMLNLKHFYGRYDEYKQVLQAINARRGLVIVGGRRMGKTSLRQHIEWNLDKDNKPYVSLDFQTVNKSLRGLKIWHQFLYYMEKALSEKNVAIQETRVDDLFKEYTDTEIQYRKNTLEKILQNDHRTILIDETDHLAELDIQYNQTESIFRWLRSLVQSNRCSVILTSYPHGKQLPWSIPMLVNNAHSPLYNFGELLNLPPWSKEENWLFIQEKLDLTGIVLPEEFKVPTLELCRGIPWITHLLGLRIKIICRHGIVTHGDWKEADKIVRKTILDELQVTVDSASKQLNSEISSDGLHDYSSLLWKALKELALKHAQEKDIHVRSYAMEWPKATSFFIDDLIPYFPEEMHHELKRQKNKAKIISQFSSMTNTIVLQGYINYDNKYSFAGNIFPMVMSS